MNDDGADGHLVVFENSSMSLNLWLVEKLILHISSNVLPYFLNAFAYHLCTICKVRMAYPRCAEHTLTCIHQRHQQNFMISIFFYLFSFWTHSALIEHIIVTIIYHPNLTACLWHPCTSHTHIMCKKWQPEKQDFGRSSFFFSSQIRMLGKLYLLVSHQTRPRDLSIHSKCWL